MRSSLERRRISAQPADTRKRSSPWSNGFSTRSSAPAAKAAAMAWLSTTAIDKITYIRSRVGQVTHQATQAQATTFGQTLPQEHHMGRVIPSHD